MKKDRILLVDDDEILRSEFKDCFDEYDFVEAKSGDEAVNIISKPHEIDLIILDVRMPGMNGLEVLKTIKKQEPDIPIIMFTGYGSKEVAIEALKGRADGFIEKPLDIDEIKEIIEKTLSKKRKEPDDDSLDIGGKIQKAKKFLEKNFRKKTGLNDAAKVTALSPKYLSRAYKEVTGKGFNEYRQILRIEEGKKLLKETGYSVDQISYKVGYENCESFIRQFKKLTGKTPAEYRQKKKK